LGKACPGFVRRFVESFIYFPDKVFLEGVRGNFLSQKEVSPQFYQ
jgi:hypothetical protein